MKVSQALRALGALLAVQSFAPSLASTTALPPAPIIAETFDVGTLQVDRYGSGTRPLILIAGLGCGPWAWYGTIAHFAATNAIYAITLPGFDGRPAAKNEASLFAAVERDLDRLIVERKLVRPAIVGHSLGGTLALAFAEREPSVARAVVAVDGLPVFPTLAFATPDARSAAANAAAASVANASPADLLAYDKRFMASLGTAKPDLVDPTAALEAKSDPAAVAAWIREDLSTDLRPDLSKIVSPVLEIAPYYAPDRTTPPMNFTQAQTVGFYQLLLGGTPNLTVTPIEGSRHFAMLDQPAAFFATLDAYLAAHV